MALLRASLGIVFLGFGLLKFIPGASPAEGLATRVLSTMSFGFISNSTGLFLIALLETAIGLSLLSGRFLRVGLALLAMATIGTLAPLVLFPQDLLTSSFAPTLEGQYVFKDVVLLFAGLLVALRERGARVVLDFDDVTHKPILLAD